MQSRNDPALLLAISVIERAIAGEGVELQEKILRDWQPTAHLCHDNVREWVALHPEHQHVRGFLVANQRPSDSSLVIAHSVVADTDGTLCDITPSDSHFSYPFVPHVGTPEEFELIAAVEPFMIEVPHALVRR